MKKYNLFIILNILSLLTVMNCSSEINSAYCRQLLQRSSTNQQQTYQNLKNRQFRINDYQIGLDQFNQTQTLSRLLQACPTNCILCPGGICSSCDTKFYLDNSNQCVSCTSLQTNCASCMLVAPIMTTVVCTSCSTGFYLDTTKNPSCQSCLDSISNCLDCKIDVPNTNLICQPDSCRTGFYRAANGLSCIICDTIDPLCAFCTFNVQGLCTECQGNNYATIDTGKCLPCNILGCSRCDNVNAAQTPQCSTCNLMFYRNPTTFQCIACRQNCMDCFFNTVTSLEQCIQCSPGYFLSSQVCVTCSTALPFCSTCAFDVNLANNCQTCQAGYLLKADPTQGCEDCTGKISNCKTCTVSGQSPICLECNTNFVKSTDQLSCIPCTTALCPVNPPACTIPSCLTCSSTTPVTCTVCITNYVLSSNGLVCSLCSSVISNCVTCSTTTPTTCITCQEKYTSSLDKLTCRSCSPIRNCLTCTALSNTLTKCTSCSSNTFPTTTTTTNNTCQSCSSVIKYCVECTLSSGVTKCTRCNKKFTLTADQLKCQPCNDIIPYCTECAILNGNNVCLRCYDCDRFIAIRNSQNIYACRPCGAYIGQCQKCVANGNTPICTSCRQGSRLNAAGTQCSFCPSGCKTCSSNNVCTSCSTGYILMRNRCYRCRLDNCVACELSWNNRPYCKVCAPRYRLRGGYCTCDRRW